MLILVVVVSTLLLGRFSEARLRALRTEKTMASLAQAKEALLGYAATYTENHAGEVLGHLPCPDTDNDGSAQPSCSLAGRSVLGRLPYRTLGLPDLRDGAGECLWYAVSGSHKSNPKAGALNWDSQGQLEIRGARGQALVAPGDARGGAAAAIIAPGRALRSRSRLATPERCSGGNDPRAYLDGAHAFPASGTSTLSQGTPTGETNDDAIVWIDAAEIFARVKMRPDFDDPGKHLNGLLDRMRDCLEAAGLPEPAGALLAGPKQAGRVPARPAACVPDGDAWAEYWDNWREMFWYARCSDGAQCLTLNASPCRAVVLFAGERSAGQSRANAGERSDVANYLEGVNLAAFRSASTVLSAAASLTIADPRLPAARDVGACLN